jgi:hypothetical protein
LPEGASCPSGNWRHPWRHPDGLFPTKTTVLGAAKREKIKTTPAAFSYSLRAYRSLDEVKRNRGLDGCYFLDSIELH